MDDMLLLFKESERPKQLSHSTLSKGGERERAWTERASTGRAPFKLCLAPAMPKPQPTTMPMPANARQIETRTSETAEADAGSENRLIVVAVCTVWLRFVHGK